MTKSRRNILKKKNRSMRGGEGIQSIIAQVSGLKYVCKIHTFRASINDLLPTLQIPNEFDSLLNKILGTSTTLKDLVADILKSFECKDIDTIAAILPQVLLFDEIGKLLEKSDFSALDETAKNGFKLYANLNAIINKPENQDLLCRILNKMESEKHIKPEHKMAFIKLFGGDEKICQSKIGESTESSESTKSTGSTTSWVDSFKSRPILDKRCGPGKEVEKPLLWGKKRCVLSDFQETTTTEKEGETTPTTTEKEGETTPTTTEGKEGETTPTTTTTEGKEGETTPTTTEGKEGKQKKGWFWGGKYKRVKHTKKSKKSKSKKSKRSKK